MKWRSWVLGVCRWWPLRDRRQRFAGEAESWMNLKLVTSWPWSFIILIDWEEHVSPFIKLISFMPSRMNWVWTLFRLDSLIESFKIYPPNADIFLRPFLNEKGGCGVWLRGVLGVNEKNQVELIVHLHCNKTLVKIRFTSCGYLWFVSLVNCVCTCLWCISTYWIEQSISFQKK